MLLEIRPVTSAPSREGLNRALRCFTPHRRRPSRKICRASTLVSLTTAVAFALSCCTPNPGARLEVVCSAPSTDGAPLPTRCSITTNPGASVEVRGAVSQLRPLIADEAGHVELLTDWNLAGVLNAMDGLIPDVGFASRAHGGQMSTALSYRVKLEHDTTDTVSARVSVGSGCSAALDGQSLPLDGNGIGSTPKWKHGWNFNSATLPKSFSFDRLSEVVNAGRPTRVMLLDIKDCPGQQTLLNAPVVLRPARTQVPGAGELRKPDGQGLPWAASLSVGPGRPTVLLWLDELDVVKMTYKPGKVTMLGANSLGNVELLAYGSNISQALGRCGPYNQFKIAGVGDYLLHDRAGFRVVVQEARTRRERARRDFLGAVRPCPNAIPRSLGRIGGEPPSESTVLEWLAKLYSQT